MKCGDKKKSVSSSKTGYLEATLLEEIKNGTYRPGDRIPPVRELCSRYGVCKQTVARAMSNLNALGILEVSHGKTTRVKQAPVCSRIELILFGYRDVVISKQDFWRDFYLGIEDEVKKYPQYNIHVSAFTSDHPEIIADELNKSKPAGLLVMGTSNAASLSILQRSNLPMICVYDYNPALDIPVVTIDIRNSFMETIELLKKKNRKRVAFLYSGEPEKLETLQGINRLKYHTFTELLQKHKLMPDDSCILKTEISDQAGYSMLMQLAHEKRLPDAAVLFSDTLAPAFFRAAFELGIKIPQDMDVIGIDDLTCGKFTIPSLTTINLARYEQGRTAMRNLIEAIQSGKPAQSTIIKTEIIRRESL